jgi:hypothetical protein
MTVAEEALRQLVQIKDERPPLAAEAEFKFETDQSNLVVSPVSAEQRKFFITQVWPPGLGRMA